MFKSLPVPGRDQSLARLTSRRRRAVAALVVCRLGVGAGLAGEVASVVVGTARKGLPFAGADRLVLVARRDTRSAALELEIPSRDVGRIRRETTSFSEIAIYSSYYAFVSAPEGATRTYGASEISSNPLPLLGVSPQLGRAFTTDDELVAAAPVALLGDRAWCELFGGDRRAVGSTPLVNGRLHQIVGVMPAGFAFPELQQLWLALALALKRCHPIMAPISLLLENSAPAEARNSAATKSLCSSTP